MSTIRRLVTVQVSFYNGRNAISSAGIATALCPHIGYKASATIAKTAVKTGKSVRELVLEQGIMTEKELEEVLDPYLMTEVGEERKEDEARRKAC